MNGRALTHEQKRQIIERIYAVWTTGTIQHLRLGQLLYCSMFKTEVGRPDLFDIEDESLAALVEAFATRSL